MTDMTVRERLLFTPCESRAELKEHILTFCHIDLIDGHVDENSTSDPMTLVWECYQSIKDSSGNLNHLASASRAGGKTLGASLVIFYAMLHFRYDVACISAGLDQVSSMMAYLDNYLGIEELKKYADRSAAKIKILKNMPPNRYTQRTKAQVRVSAATPKGVQSIRANLLISDELDYVNKKVIERFAYIATQSAEGKPPVYLFLSSLQSADGPMVDMLNMAQDPDEDIRVHKWSTVDTVKKCEPERHLPDEPRRHALIDLNLMKTYWDGETDYDALTPEQKTRMTSVDAFAGCRRCKIWIACQARAVKIDYESRMQQNIRSVANIVSKIKSPDILISNTLNLRPSSAGLIFRNFKRSEHCLSRLDAYEWITGGQFNPMGLSEEDYALAEESGTLPEPTTQQIYDVLLASGFVVTAGIDYGINATCVVTAYNRKTERGFVLMARGSQELATHFDPRSWSRKCLSDWFLTYRPSLICPDTADAKSVPGYFRGGGIPVKSAKPRLIDTGVGFIRGMLFDPITNVSRFAMLEEETMPLRDEFEKWSQKKGPMGYLADTYEDANDHYLDALRYSFDSFISGPGVMRDHSAASREVEKYDTDEEILVRRKIERTGAGPGPLTQDQVRDSLLSAVEGTYSQHVTKKTGRFSLR